MVQSVGLYYCVDSSTLICFSTFFLFYLTDNLLRLMAIVIELKQLILQRQHSLISFCFLSFVSFAEFSDCLLICIWIWILAQQPVTRAKPVSIFRIAYNMHNLQAKLYAPCRGSEPTQEDLTAADLKKIFQIMHLQSSTALVEAEKGLQDYVSWIWLLLISYQWPTREAWAVHVLPPPTSRSTKSNRRHEPKWKVN